LDERLSVVQVGIDKLLAAFDELLGDEKTDFAFQVYAYAGQIESLDDLLGDCLIRKMARAKTDEERCAITMTSLRHIPNDRPCPAQLVWLFGLLRWKSTRWAVPWAYSEFDDDVERMLRHAAICRQLCESLHHSIPDIDEKELIAMYKEIFDEE